MSRAKMPPAEAVVDYVDIRGTDPPYGFVYFRDTIDTDYKGNTVRVGYMGGSGRNTVAEHLVTPYLFQANWGIAEAQHYVAAWKALAEEGVPGFRDNPEVVRIAIVDPSGVHRVSAIGVTELEARGREAHRAEQQRRRRRTVLA